MEINYKQLLKEDTDFEQFFNEIIEQFIKDNQTQESLRFIYLLYESGLSPKQVAKLMKEMAR